MPPAKQTLLTKAYTKINGFVFKTVPQGLVVLVVAPNAAAPGRCFKIKGNIQGKVDTFFHVSFILKEAETLAASL